MSQDLATDPALLAPDRSRFAAGWPLLLAVTVWAIGLPLLPQLSRAAVSGTATTTLLGLAVLAVIAATVALFKLPGDRITLPFIGLAASVGTLLVLAPLDRSPEPHALARFALVAPWRYALTPLVVHFALELGWPHLRQRWAGWMIGWYATQAGLLLVVVAGLVMGEVPLVDTVDGTFRSMIIEPVGALAALACTVMAMTVPVRGRVLRRALLWTAAALVFGLVPLLLGEYVPALSHSIDGAVTPARLALVALPIFCLIAALSLPLRDAVLRDLLGHRLAATLLEGNDLAPALRQIAATLHDVFSTRGVGVRISEPETTVTVGEISPQAFSGPIALAIEGDEEHHVLILPIGRSSSPLGEVRLEARFAGAFGATERDWLVAFMAPIGSVLRNRHRELADAHRSNEIAARLASTAGQLAVSARQLPIATENDGVAVPPPVDAREVLAQMSDGVTGIARNGEGLAMSAGDARDHARGASDSIARGLDALTALSGEVSRLTRIGEEIAANNDTVSGVAFRTNLVANNAALEATRAGAAGRTFGVLAEEVRRLADTTAATSAAIEERTSALAIEVANVTITLEGTRQALATAIREAEAGESAAQRLNDAAVELEDTARSLRPVVSEANAVAKRRNARDQHLTNTLDRFLTERAALARALAEHRDAMERLAKTLGALAPGD